MEHRSDSSDEWTALSSGHAMARGAFTIINGIASGHGGACGVALRFLARFQLTDRPGEVESRFLGPGSNSHMDDRLVRACSHRLLEEAGLLGTTGALVETVSEIPASRGLKSSSAAANAILLAGLSALDRTMEPLDVVNMGVDCAVDAGVTLTGAYDDAVATMFGGAVLTDNENRVIISWPEVPPDLHVLFLITDRKIQKDSLHRDDFKPIHDQVQEAFQLALDGDVARAITLNGRAYAPIVGVDDAPAPAALAAGAWAAGMTGTGPAIAVVYTVEAEEASPGMVLTGEEYTGIREDILGGDDHV